MDFDCGHSLRSLLTRPQDVRSNGTGCSSGYEAKRDLEPATHRLDQRAVPVTERLILVDEMNDGVHRYW